LLNFADWLLLDNITDAHENGDDVNTETDHRMGYNSNAVGRLYALENYKRSELL